MPNAGKALLPIALVLASCGDPDLLPDDLGVSLDLGSTDAGVAPDAGPDLGSADLGATDLGRADLGASDLGASDLGAADFGSPDAGSLDQGSPDVGTPASCVRSLCMAGAFTRTDGANPDFAALCERLPGLIRDGSETLFTFSSTGGALDALVGALDTNADGRVDGSDEDCDVVLVGYSWGGVNTTHLGADFVADARVSAARAHVELMITLDPYSPIEGRNVDIDDGVQRYYEYRHSVSPSTDCSHTGPLGPYEGLPPICGGLTECTDYDYSLAPSERFSGDRRTWLGSQIGHCTVVDAATPAVLHNVQNRTAASGVPPTVQVTRR